jgi:hypothetical protein
LEVPEADAAEQLAALPDPTLVEDDAESAATQGDDIAADIASRSAEADPADVVEQTLEVAIDEEYR